MANEIARRLRKTMTRQEVALWRQLRPMKSRGFHVRRQAPVGPYVVDFVCFARKLVIEADGGQHNAASGIARDGRRDAFLKAEGFRVLRFWNNDIDDNLDGVMSAIAEALNNSTPPG